MDGREFALRQPCRHCSGTEGVIRVAGGQNVVRCKSCNLAQFNAPKRETGESTRSTSTSPIPPKKRHRILERDGYRCGTCGRGAEQVILHVGHVVSIDDGPGLGMSDADLHDDENLVALCEECNLGIGRYSLRARHLLSILVRRYAGSGSPPTA